ncbi:MAG: restriction endonuclease subunit S [Methanotrichaceae archaeon]|nr:restriction endonuclease subunit S [Methanotrichaceae archaeon]
MSSSGQTRLLGSVVTLDKGKPPIQHPYLGPDAELYLTPEYLRGNAGGELAKPSANAVRVSDGETIILWDGSNAGEIFRARNGVLASTMSRAHHIDSFDKDYFFYALKKWENYLKGQTSGSGIPHVDKEVLYKIKLFEPFKPEQIKIAKILSTADRAIEQTEALIAKQQRIKTGLMQDLLTRGIDDQGNLRSEETHEFKDSPLGRIPVGWDILIIKDCLASVDPAMRSGPFGSALRKDELAVSGIPLLGIDNIFPEDFRRNYTRFVPPRKARQLARYLVRPRDIMITIMGTVGRCCVVPDDIGEALSSKHVWTISLDPLKYSAALACYQVNYSPWVLSHFAQDEQGGIMGAIKSETIRTTRLPVPPRNEQRVIEEYLACMNADHTALKVHLAKLRSLKTALMQDLLTGKRRVTALLAKPEEAST